jgi:hypothetical protein
MVVESIGEDRFQRLSGALVQLLATLDQQRVVGDFLGKRVLEDVLETACGRLLGDNSPA